MTSKHQHAPKIVDKADVAPPQKQGDSQLHNQAASLLSTQDKKHHRPAQDRTDDKKLDKKPELPHLEITGIKHKSSSSKHLDGRKSVADHVKSGAIVDKSGDTKPSEHAERKLEAKNADDKSPPKITVGMQNIDGSPGPRVKPHFKVKQNGQIEMSGDPEKLRPKEISIVLERKEGQLNPTEAQSKAADGLVKYLSARVKSSNDEAKRSGIELDDQDSVISNQLEKREKLRPSKELRNVTAETRRSVEQTHRFQGASGVDMPRSQTDRMGSFSTRDVPRLSGESSRTMGIKEAVAGLWKPDKQEPYETVRKHPDGGYRVGRYGFSGDQINGFLKEIGSPPDPALIEKLIASGKLPKDFGEKLKDQKFVDQLKALADKLDKGQQPNKEEIKTLLPKVSQEALVGIMIDEAKDQVGDKPGAIAAGLLSGRAATDLSPSDVITPEGKQLSDAGDRLYDLATQRRQSETSNEGNSAKVPVGNKRELIETALTKAGVPVSAANIAAVNLIVTKESSWNPNIVNNWDSNAKKGIPSKGLMQTIEPTFRAHSIAGHKNIFNPIDNMIAGIRYSVFRYGSLQNVPGVKAVNRGAAYRGY